MPETMDEQEQALADQLSFDAEELHRIDHELEVHDVPPERRADVHDKLSLPSTVGYDDRRFSITRNLHHGWNLEWHDQRRAA
ncbi:MAG: hypothetical protein HYY50_01655 [Candidatus Kerfeldbacteria bacterium]|nr:hypothetical protein [Candidatus Kerfeldbacteria bacterium]